MAESPRFIVREAKPDDMYQVHRLIKALAEFENLEQQVEISPEVLIEDGFGKDHPAFKCFIAEDQNKENNSIIGYALYYMCYSTWLGKSIFLEDLFVAPPYRNCGIGKELVLMVARVAYETNQRLDFHVLKWNPAKEFYKNLGAIDLTEAEEWNLYRLDKKSLEKLLKK